MAIKIKIQDLRKMGSKELENKLKELKMDLIKMNAQRSTGTALENPGKIKQVKKTISRILTILHSKANKPKMEELKKHE